MHRIVGMDRMIGDLLDLEQVAQGQLKLKPEKVDIRTLLEDCRFYLLQRSPVSHSPCPFILPLSR
jgi:signal transduction histidine kinase